MTPALSESERIKPDGHYIEVKQMNPLEQELITESDLEKLLTKAKEMIAKDGTEPITAEWLKQAGIEK